MDAHTTQAIEPGARSEVSIASDNRTERPARGAGVSA